MDSVVTVDLFHVAVPLNGPFLAVPRLTPTEKNEIVTDLFHRRVARSRLASKEKERERERRAAQNGGDGGSCWKFSQLSGHVDASFGTRRAPKIPVQNKYVNVRSWKGKQGAVLLLTPAYVACAGICRLFGTVERFLLGPSGRSVDGQSELIRSQAPPNLVFPLQESTRS